MKVASNKRLELRLICCACAMAAVLLAPLAGQAEEGGADASVAQARQSESSQGEAVASKRGEDALIATAITAWALLVAFVGLGFRRQRQLARDLERMEQTLTLHRAQTDKEKEKDVRLRTYR